MRNKMKRNITFFRIAKKERAYNDLESVLERWVHGGDAECILEEFKEELEAKK